MRALSQLARDYAAEFGLSRRDLARDALCGIAGSAAFLAWLIAEILLVGGAR